ncbi:MAG: rhomboid family intramembrane serine protease [Pseudonocardiaceae bacterium]
MTGPVCIRHPGRETGVRCTRCDRPACPDCLREASVGYQCVDCVATAARSQPRARTVPWSGAAQWSGPTQRLLVVPGLIAINVAIFAITVAEAASVVNNPVVRNAASPLFQQWALRRSAVADGAWWQPLTAGFLHIGPVHLAINMIALWVIGRDLEQILGSFRFLVVYLVSLLGGSLAVLLFDPRQTAGASGAVFGLMGGFVVVLMKMKLSPRPALTIILLNVVITFAIPGISRYGHFGGLAFGTAVTAALLYAPTRRH